MALVDILALGGPALVGAVTGAAATYYVQRRRDRERDENNREALRKSLLTEIDGFTGMDLEYDHAPEISHFETTIYDSNTHQLGLLSKGERHAVMKFYETVREYMNRPSKDWEVFRIARIHRRAALRELRTHLESEERESDVEDEQEPSAEEADPAS